MKKPCYFFLIALFIVCSAFLTEKPASFLNDYNNFSFTTGEELNYQINFGFFKAGEGKMIIQNKIFNVRGRPCFKIDFYGKTTGAASWLSEVNDNWGAYIDAVEIKPHVSYRNIHEGNYRKKEIAEFNHQQNFIHYKELDIETEKVKDTEKIQAPEQIFDMICGMAYLRNYDFNSLQPADTLNFKAFLEDSIYDFKIVYYGKDKVKTQAGKFNAHMFKPIMPENKMFRGRQPVTVWFSDDENRIPVRIDADFVVGSGRCSLTDYKNLKSKPNLLN